MTEGPLTGPAKRRVRTGCLTCRRRRRKCDETKPECQNCKSKNLTCRYGLKITFVDESARRNHYSRDSRTSEHSSASLVVNGEAHEQATSALEGYVNQTSSIETNRALSPHEPHNCPDSTYSMQESSNEEHISVNSEGDDIARLHPSNFTNQQTLAGALTTRSYTSGDDTVQCIPVQRSSNSQSIGSASVPDLAGALRSPAVDDFERPAQHFAEHNVETLWMGDEQYELELICYYRYTIAPLLDLGIGTLYYGIQALITSAITTSVYNAILALSSYHRGESSIGGNGTDRRSSELYANRAQKSLFLTTSSEDIMTARLLLTWRDFLSTPPELWHEQIRDVGEYYLAETSNIENRRVFARLALSARLLMPPGPIDKALLSIYGGTLEIVPGRVMTLPQQFEQSLLLLERAISFSQRQSHTPSSRSLPVIPTWQLNWSMCQIWYATRSSEMRQIIEVKHPESSQNEWPGSHPSFSVLLFSNTCATAANLVHHLTNILLLQSKPRSIKAIAESTSSTSLIWHAQRVVSIATEAANTEICDPLVVAAVLYAARNLSHEIQTGTVVEILRNVVATSGMKLEGEIEKLLLSRDIARS